MEGESDDPEERYRRIQAKQEAENIGTVIGLVAGVAIAAHQAVQEEPAQPENTIEPDAPDMNGPVMRQTM